MLNSVPLKLTVHLVAMSLCISARTVLVMMKVLKIDWLLLLT
jgi:hypothetical protein